jgi:hypothetical protein
MGKEGGGLDGVTILSPGVGESWHGPFRDGILNVNFRRDERVEVSSYRCVVVRRGYDVHGLQLLTVAESALDAALVCTRSRRASPGPRRGLCDLW